MTLIDEAVELAARADFIRGMSTEQTRMIRRLVEHIYSLEREVKVERSQDVNAEIDGRFLAAQERVIQAVQRELADVEKSFTGTPATPDTLEQVKARVFLALRNHPLLMDWLVKEHVHVCLDSPARMSVRFSSQAVDKMHKLGIGAEFGHYHVYLRIPEDPDA